MRDCSGDQDRQAFVNDIQWDQGGHAFDSDDPKYDSEIAGDTETLRLVLNVLECQ